MNYEETFSSIAMLKSIRMILSITTYYDYEIWQMGVKTIFLNGYLDEKIYMPQQDRFIKQGQEQNVHMLKISICGLK